MLTLLHLGVLLVCLFTVSHASLYGPYGMSFTRYMCTPDDCIPPSLKESMRNCWSATAQKLWSSCVGESGSCNPGEEFQVSRCLYSRVENMTEITVKEYRAMKNTMFTFTALLECAGDKITLNMQNCTLNAEQNYFAGRRKFRNYPEGSVPVRDDFGQGAPLRNPPPPFGDQPPHGEEGPYGGPPN